jgi:uncharacterized cupredoxin-like copper-binding protein
MKFVPGLRHFHRAVLSASLTLALAAGAQAAGSHGHGHASDIGKPGNAAEASRTVTVTMTDNRFAPERIAVKKGETVRFVLKNEGKFVHEFNIGTAAMHARHQKEMAMMVEHGALEVDKINHDRMKMDMGGGVTMEHNDPNSVLLEPGKSAELVWTFATDTRLEFACNVPGHYESGMTGDITIGK